MTGLSIRQNDCTLRDILLVLFNIYNYKNLQEQRKPKVHVNIEYAKGHK